MDTRTIFLAMGLALSLAAGMLPARKPAALIDVSLAGPKTPKPGRPFLVEGRLSPRHEGELLEFKWLVPGGYEIVAGSAVGQFSMPSVGQTRVVTLTLQTGASTPATLILGARLRTAEGRLSAAVASLDFHGGEPIRAKGGALSQDARGRPVVDHPQVP